MKLLLDENLSPLVAEALARDDGVDACHIRDRGLLGATDPQVLELAFVEDRILVTKNVSDFAKLAGARELHAGIVFVEQGDLTRDEQQSVIRRAVAAITGEQAAGRDMVNRVLRITLHDEPAFETTP